MSSSTKYFSFAVHNTTCSTENVVRFRMLDPKSTVARDGQPSDRARLEEIFQEAAVRDRMSRRCLRFALPRSAAIVPGVQRTIVAKPDPLDFQKEALEGHVFALPMAHLGEIDAAAAKRLEADDECECNDFEDKNHWECGEDRRRGRARGYQQLAGNVLSLRYQLAPNEMRQLIARIELADRQSLCVMVVDHWVKEAAGVTHVGGFNVAFAADYDPFEGC